MTKLFSAIILVGLLSISICRPDTTGGDQGYVGGYNNQKVDQSKKDFQASLEEAKTQIAAQTDLVTKGYQFDRVVSASQQVVAGINYKILIQYKNDQGQTARVQVIVWSKPWLQSYQVTSVKVISDDGTDSQQNVPDVERQRIPNERLYNSKLFQTAKQAIIDQEGFDKSFEFKSGEIVGQHINNGLIFTFEITFANNSGVKNIYQVDVLSKIQENIIKVLEIRKVE